MRAFLFKTGTVAALWAVGASAVAPVVEAGDWFNRRPVTSVEKLARRLDDLEEHIEEYGTVVAKQPDVWGEERLTKYRTEFEHYMELEAGNFKRTINAAISRSDQAFLSNALSISAAISGPQAVIQTPSAPSGGAPSDPPPEQPSGLVPTDQTEEKVVTEYGDDPLKDKDGNPLPKSTTKTTTTSAPATPAAQPAPSAATPLQIPDHIAASGLIDPTTLTRTAARVPSALGFGTPGSEGVALEPTLFLDQKARYLNHLAQLRRISAGDDNSDAPGYALRLVRIPVSVLPGRKTQAGYGAEVNIIAEHNLGTEWNPNYDVMHSTMRDLIINDLLDEVTLYVIKAADEKAWELDEKVRAASEKSIDDRNELALLEQVRNTLPEIARAGGPKAVNMIRESIRSRGRDGKRTDVEKRYSDVAEIVQKFYESFPTVKGDASFHASDIAKSKAILDREIKKREAKIKTKRADEKEAEKAAQAILEKLATGARARRSRYSVPDSIRSAVYAESFAYRGDCRDDLPGDYIHAIRLGPISEKYSHFYGSDSADQYQVAEKFLREELRAAYDFLNENEELWDLTAGLYEIIRGGHLDALKERQKQYARLVACHRDQAGREEGNAYDYQVMEDLGWCILVQAALLNQQFVDDIERTADEMQCECLGEADGVRFFDERYKEVAFPIFRDYVKCRWPIHVFAIDPVTQDQNVADSFSRRREAQFALAAAVASGQVSAQNITRFMRRLETEMETVALNRSVVGFSHGNDTFGWRFYPRVQSPPTEGNLTVGFRDLLLGGVGRDKADLKHRRLEAGQRECVAIVVMPSFMPSVLFDVRSNWFRLTDPSHREFDLKDTVKLSHEVQELHDLREACYEDRERYRQGEVWRLCKAVDQLDRRLPLQTQFVQVPLQENLTGFELLARGAMSLGPELRGYYGAQGIDQSEDTTDIILVGSNFSVHDTRVVVGGREIDSANVRLLSRETIRVRVPKNVTTVGDRTYAYVATPYGVSPKLDIKVVNGSADEAEKAAEKAVADHVKTVHHGDPSELTWSSTDEVAGVVNFCKKDLKITSFSFGQAGQKGLKLKVAKATVDPEGFRSAPKLESVEVAFRVTAHQEDGTEIDRKDIFHLVDGKNRMHWLTGDKITTVDSLEPVVVNAVGKMDKLTPEALSYLKIKGYVRLVKAKAIYAVPDELKVKLVVQSDDDYCSGSLKVDVESVPSLPQPAS